MLTRKFILSFLIGCLCLTVPAQQRELNYYIDQGLQKSPVLQDFQYQVQSRTADSLLIRAGQKPLVEGTSLLSYAPVINGRGYDAAITNGQNIGAAVAVSQPLFNGRILKGEYQRIGIERNRAGNSYDMTAMQLKHDITAQYLIACGDQEFLQWNKGLAALMKEEAGILKQLVGQGQQSQASFLGFQIEYQSIERQVKESSIVYQRDLADLNIICGITDTGEISLKSPSFNIDSTIRGAGNPFLKQYFIDSMQISNSRLLVDNRYRPSVKWMADAGLLSSQFSTIGKNFGMSAGLTFSVPLYDGHQKRIEYSKIDLEEKTRMKYLEFFLTQRDQEIDRILKELYATESTITLYTSQKENTEQMLESARKLLNAGMMSITDYILMIRNYRELSLTLNQARFKKLGLINDYNYIHW